MQSRAMEGLAPPALLSWLEEEPSKDAPEKAGVPVDAHATASHTHGYPRAWIEGKIAPPCESRPATPMGLQPIVPRPEGTTT